MVHVLPRVFSGWPPLRAALALGGYALLLYCLLCVVCLWPGKALALSGYSRILNPTNYQAMLNARAVAQRSLVGAAIAAAPSGGASVALRMVPGIGWAAIGVSAALTLAQIYYSQSQVATIQSHASTPGAVSIPGWNTNNPPIVGGIYVCPNPNDTVCGLLAGIDQYVKVPISTANWTGTCGTIPPGWGQAVIGNDGVTITCAFYHPIGNSATLATQAPPTPPTGTQVANYIGGLPSTDPLSLPANTDPLGATGPAPDPAASTISDPINITDAQTTVVPSTSVPSGSVVVDPNANPPAGTQTTTPSTQQTTTQTTSTTDPNTGVTTTNTTDTTTASCGAGTHDERSFGSILQTHIDTWKGSGILGQVALLQSLTWPDSLPTITWTSGTWGTHHINFNDWAGIFTALRAIVIAGAGFAAYRIVFVGGGA